MRFISWAALILNFTFGVKCAFPECTHYIGKQHSAETQVEQQNDFANGSLKVPPCGETPCDNPATIASYLLPQNQHLTGMKILKYRVVNIANSDGSDPIVRTEQVEHQHEELNEAFAPYNITFDLEHMIIRNTSLRQTGILFGCHPSMIGDGICQPECVLYSTFNDGGDCDPKDAVCSTDMIHDGVCQQVCNDAEHDYDGGDCCIMSPDNEPLCLDPESPNRRQYMTIEDFKDFVKLTNHDRMNVMFAEWTNSYLIGLATFPWERSSKSFRGGVVMKPKEYGMAGHTKTLIHEVGHILGLWHVHHGTSEMPCDDFCYEWEASMTNGDLCSDTNPSPMHMLCSNPTPRAACNRLQTFPRAPVTNYMSYSGDECMDHFTPQQAARMHCYINRHYNHWRADDGPKSSIMLYPVSTSSQRIAIHWEQIPHDNSHIDDNSDSRQRFSVARHMQNDPKTLERQIYREAMLVDSTVQSGQMVTYTVHEMDNVGRPQHAPPGIASITIIVK